MESGKHPKFRRSMVLAPTGALAYGDSGSRFPDRRHLGISCDIRAGLHNSISHLSLNKQANLTSTTAWEPRYTIYRNVLDLHRMAIAVARVSELRSRSLDELEEDADVET